MSYFAKVENGLVVSVIAAEQDVIDSGIFGHGWVQTSYNTRGGVHYGQDGQPSGREQLRKNYAGIGYTYDSERDAFIPPKPYPSWVLVEETCQWMPPISYPNIDINSDGKFYVWSEDTLNWVESV